MVSEAILHPGASAHSGVLVWQWTEPTTALSSAAVGGGLQPIDDLVNISVPLRYDRTDLDVHMQEVADELGISGNGAGLFTAVNVKHVRRQVCEGVAADATVGISKPTWASDPQGGLTSWLPGTINTVVQLPVALSNGAAVNAVITATEAKAQALFDCDVSGTGTASDSIVITWPNSGDPEPFAGPRSEWGSRLAQATYGAVKTGVEDSIARHLES